MVNIGIIGITLTNPTYTIVNSSKELNQFIGTGDVIIGPLGHELSFENKVFPLFYVPNGKSLGKINQNLSNYPPKYLLVSNGSEFSKQWPQLNEFKNTTYITTIELLPYPFTKDYKAILDLYKIN